MGFFNAKELDEIKRLNGIIELHVNEAEQKDKKILNLETKTRSLEKQIQHLEGLLTPEMRDYETLSRNLENLNITIDLLRNYVLSSKLHIPAMRLKRRANLFLRFLYRSANILNLFIDDLFFIFFAQWILFCPFFR